MLAFVFSQLTGLLRLVLVTGAFGTTAEMEAFTPANRVTETLFTLVAGGALGSAFIPTFTGLLAKGQRTRAWELASAMANLVLVILILLSLLVAVFAPQIASTLLVPGFLDEPEKLQLTVNLLRWMLPTAAIFGLSGLVMGILNSHQVFLMPALAPSMYNLGQIFGVLVLAPRWGIYGLAIGVLAGSLLHLGVQLPGLARLGGRYLPILGLRLAEVREVLVLMGPRLFGVAIVQLNFWVNTFLASFMPEGSVNGLYYAWVLMLMPQALIAQSVATAALPTFSAQYALGRVDELRRSLAESLRGVLLLAIPATAGLILLRWPLVAVLFERGEFDEQSTQLVAWALLWYAAGLVGHSIVEIISRSFYALHDTRTPVILTSLAMGLNVIFSLAFAALFSRLGWMPHGGLALANSLATFLESAGLLVLMRRRLGGGLEGLYVLRGAGKALLAALVMSVVIWGWLLVSGGQADWLVTLIGIAAGGLVYGLIVLALRVEEAHSLLRLVFRKLGRQSPL